MNGLCVKGPARRARPAPHGRHQDADPPLPAIPHRLLQDEPRAAAQGPLGSN